MPKVREGYRQVATQLPADVWDAVEALAMANGRSIIDEVEHALRRHLEAPPVVRRVAETPPMPRVEIDPGKGKPKGGRPRKKPEGGG